MRNFHNYAGRGIRVCDEWRDDFAVFLAHMGLRPSPGHSIDRIDNNKGYEPGNCRWATRAEQLRNTRRNRFVLVGGERLCFSDAAKRLGVSPPTVRKMLERGELEAA
ncbi:MAG TPA: helix-turn-helix domain-containing protein [Gaiellaceae bacterium]|nr:helix-turn-helix domain-containing protein [Gaiellaceae bacterium]